MKFSTLLMSIVLLLVLVSSPEPHRPLPRAEAAIFTVTSLADSGPGTLRQAILDANGAAGADVIDFSVTGTIALSSQLDVTDDVTINGSGITLDGNSTTRIMQISLAATVVLNDLTFQNGSFPFAAAIYNNGGTLTINNSTFNSNTATVGSGGAITHDGSTLTVNNSTFSSNTAPVGGAIYILDDTLVITNSTFSGNQANNGGAIVNSGLTLTITNSTFSGNQATSGNGGAIRNENVATITNSTFSGNTATEHGGAILIDGTTTITSSTFSGNMASSAGGTLYRFGGTADVQSSLIVGGDCNGGITNGGNNLRFNAANCPGPGANPQLGPLQNNGGPTHTMLPALTSPAVDAYASPCATATDQRGITRPQGLCDIGATEQDNTVALDTSAVCNGPDLEVTIVDGNGPFNITASAGVNTPVNGVSVGTTTINGPEKWDDLTVTETTGDMQSINLGQFRCRSDERPVPTWPAHRSHTTSMYPLFSWTAITDANNYRMFVFDDANPATRTVDIRQNSGGPTSMQLSTPLPDGRLFWRVRGRTNRIWSLWSIRFTLFKDPVAPFSASTPLPTIDLNPPFGDGSAPNPVPTIGPAPTFPAPPNSR